MKHSGEDIVARAHRIAQHMSTRYSSLFDDHAASASKAPRKDQFLHEAYFTFQPDTVVDMMIAEVLKETFDDSSVSMHGEHQSSYFEHRLHSDRSSEALEDYITTNQDVLKRVGLSQALDTSFLRQHVVFQMTDATNDSIYTFHETRAYSILLALLEQYDLVDATLNTIFQNIHQRLPNIHRLPDVAKLRVDRSIQLTILSALHDAIEGLSDDYNSMPLQWLLPVLTDYVANEFVEQPVEEVFFLFPTMQRFRKTLQKRS